MPNYSRFLWFLPMDTDVSHIGMWPQEGPAPTVDRLAAIVGAAERAGFEGLLVPTVYSNPLDDLTTAAAVLARTSSAYLLLAIRPNQYHPAQAAKMLASLCFLFPGRIRINVTSGSSDEDRWIRSADDRDDRGGRLLEWLAVFTAVLYGDRAVHHQGRFWWADGTRLRPPLAGHLPVALSGSSAAAHTATAEYADEHLIFAAPLETVRREVARVRSIPAGDRDIAIIMRVHLVVRPSEDEARAAAAEIVSRIDPRVLAVMNAESSDPRSQRSYQHTLAQVADLYAGPNLWTGIGMARFGAASALVGDPGQVADRLTEFQEAGVDGFILSGYPKLAECDRFAELMTPVLRERGLMPEAGQVPALGAQGAMARST
jgi:alkanesulfonate monooxygenase